MSLLDDQNLIEIKLYYKYSVVGSGKRLVILEDKKVQELLNDPAQSDSVETLETNWSLLTWKEQNEVMNLSSQAVNQQTGERQFNFLAYRDAIIKRCLRNWNITINEKPVPVSPDAIDKLPGPVVTSLYQKFESLIDYSEKELGN
ncbi:MAG: hypothetical protein ABGF52_11330 [Candidatus Asgardarchaeum sp.]